MFRHYKTGFGPVISDISPLIGVYCYAGLATCQACYAFLLLTTRYLTNLP